MSAVDDADEGWSEWPAPAKLNLFLQLVGRRDDGYHLLQSVFQLLDWGDTVVLRGRADGHIRRLAGLDSVTPAQDLGVRAARLLQQVSGVSAGADLRIDKRIPAGGGFGGGSSDAASVLVALNRLWGCGLDVDRLAELGLRLGADVPFFVRGHSAWAEGVGEQLTTMSLPAAWYVLVDSGVQVSTAELFQAPELTRNAAPIKMADFVPSRVGVNAFEQPVRARAPRIGQLLNAIATLGQGGLTGTGGGCFLRVDSQQAALQAAQALQSFGYCVVARGVNRSPLWESIESMDAAMGAAI